MQKVECAFLNQWQARRIRSSMGKLQALRNAFGEPLIAVCAYRRPKPTTDLRKDLPTNCRTTLHGAAKT